MTHGEIPDGGEPSPHYHDELTHDVLHNQILKSTLVKLMSSHELDGELRKDLSDILDKFDSVRLVPVNNDAFRQVQLHSNNRFYRLLLHVCALLYRQMLPDSDGEGYRFADFTPEQLDVIFESFVRNLLAREQSAYRVKVERFRWQDVLADEATLACMPTMKTDASMESDDRKLVIETKFYEKPLRRHHQSDKPSIISGHLYQLFAYLQNLSAKDGRSVDGLLLYAQAEEEFSFDAQLFGHAIRVATVDLSLPPAAIRAKLFECADIPPEHPVAA